MNENTDLAQRGADIKSRRERLGITQEQMADAIGRKDRGTIIKAEAGHEGSARTIALVEQYLDGYEASLADTDDADANEAVEFRIAGNFGVEVVIKGPVADFDRLEQSAMRIAGLMGKSV